MVAAQSIHAIQIDLPANRAERAVMPVSLLSSVVHENDSHSSLKNIRTAPNWVRGFHHNGDLLRAIAPFLTILPFRCGE